MNFRTRNQFSRAHNVLVIALLVAIPSILYAATTPDPKPNIYDVVIKNGRVMNPATGFDEIANIGINADRISIITTEGIVGDKVINAQGHVVAPGFIDTHYHGTLPIHYRAALRNGVTSAMDLEYGALGTLVDRWYDEREGASPINFGTASSHELARVKVLDGVDAIDTSEAIAARSQPNWSAKVPSQEESKAILEVIDSGLAHGAIGVGSTLGYMPGVTAQALLNIQTLSASYGRQISVHLRHTPGTSTDEINGAQEILANAVALNAPAMINHFNNAGWQTVHDLLLKLQSQGYNVWGEIYPYAVGSTSINAVFLNPENWQSRLGKVYAETIYDPSANKFLDKEAFLKLRETSPVHPVLIHKMPEPKVVKWIGLQGTTIASDGLPDLRARPLDKPLDSRRF